MKILFFVLCISLFGNYLLAQNNNPSQRKTVKKINLYFISPMSNPSNDLSFKHVKNTGFELVIRSKHFSAFNELPKLIHELKECPESVCGKFSKHKFYISVSYGFFRRKDKIELFDDCSIKINGKFYEENTDFYQSILLLLPTGLKEHWQKYYACF